ncbi:MAG: hypothetical protein ACLU99_12670 [Alphaproteobacteria bacterium]
MIVSDDEEEEYTPTLIERVTGFSIAKRNRKKQKRWNVCKNRYLLLFLTMNFARKTD